MLELDGTDLGGHFGKSVFELAVSVREERCSPIASCPACPAAPARTAPAAGQPRGSRAGSVRERYRACYERLSSKIFLVKKITFVNDSALGKWTCPDQRRFHLGSPGAATPLRKTLFTLERAGGERGFLQVWKENERTRNSWSAWMRRWHMGLGWSNINHLFQVVGCLRRTSAKWQRESDVDPLLLRHFVYFSLAKGYGVWAWCCVEQGQTCSKHLAVEFLYI